MPQANTRFIPLALDLDLKPALQKLDAYERRLKKLDGPLSSGLNAEERRTASAAAQLQRQHSSAMIAEERRINAAVESLQRQRSTALVKQWREEERVAKLAADAQIREARRAADEQRRIWGVVGVVSGAALVAAGREVKQFLDESVKLATELRRQVANIASIKPEIDTSQVFKALREMATRVPQTAEQLADSLYDTFSSINVTQAEGLQLVEKFARGATAAVTDVRTFGTAVVGVMNAYGLTVRDVDHIQDVFFNTVRNGVVTGAELAQNLGLVTQAAKNTGVRIDELGALIAGVTKEGGSAAQNINNLANTLQKLPTKETQRALRELKVETIETQSGAFRPFISILSDLKEKLDDLPSALRAAKLQEIFPDQQARTGLQTTLSQLEFIKTALKENETQAGAFGRAYETMANTSAVASALQENALRNFQLAVGDTIIQNAAWVKATEIVTQQINAQTEALEKSGTQTQIFANDFTIMLAKAKAQIIPFTGFVFQTVRLIGNALGLILGGVVYVIDRMLEEILLGLQKVGTQIVNAVIAVINGLEKVVEKVGLKGAIGIGGQLDYLPLPERRPNLGSENVLNNLRQTFNEIPELAKSIHSLAAEGRLAREEIDRAVAAQNRLRAAKAQKEQQLLEDFEAGRAVMVVGPAGTARVAEAERLAAEQRARLSPTDRVALSEIETGGRARRARPEFTADQLRFAREIVETGLGLGANERQLLAALAAALVESNLRNVAPGRGDRDSVGIFQQRPSQGWGTAAQLLNIGEAARRFFLGAGTNLGALDVAQGGSVGQLAQRVQRSAFPGRYDQRLGQAQRLFDLVIGEGVSDRTLKEAEDNRRKQFLERLRQPGELTFETAGLGTSATRHLTTYEAAQKAIDDQLNEQTRALYNRRMNLLNEYHQQWQLAQQEREHREMDYVVEIGRAEATLHEMRVENANAASVANRRLAQVKGEEVDLTRRIQLMQDAIATGPYNQSLRIQLALLEDIADIRRRDEEAIIAQNRAQLELADAGVVHSERVRASVLEHLASQESASESLARTLTDSYDAVTDVIARGISKITGGIRVLDNLLASIVNRVISRAFAKLLDFLFPPAGGGVQQQGGFSFGGLLRGIFGRGGGTFSLPGAGPGGTPVFNAGGGLGALFGSAPVPPQSLAEAAQSDATRRAVEEIASGGLGRAAGGALGGGLQTGLFASLAATGPALAVVYGVSSLIGAARGELSNFQAATGGGIFGFILNRSQRERQDEQRRNQVSHNTGTAIWELIARAQRGEVTLAQARQDFEQIRASYFEGIQPLRGRARRHAELQWANDFAPLWRLVEENARASEVRRVNEGLFIPTFADGGLLSGRFSGRVPGRYDRRDDRLIAVSGDEVVLTPRQWQPIKPYLAAARVPGFDGGAAPSVPAGGGFSPTLVVESLTLNLEVEQTVGLDQKSGVRVLHATLKTPGGKELVIGTVRAHVREKRRDGLAGDIEEVTR